MDQPPDRKLHYARYFYINRTKDGGLAYRRNMEAINKALSRCGFFDRGNRFQENDGGDSGNLPPS